MTNATNLTISDLNTALDDEPRVQDLRLAQSLGFARPRIIRELIARNSTELERYGSLAVRHGKSRGQEYAEYWLTEGQALCLAALSNAPRAPEARHALISVYMAYRRGQTATALPAPDYYCQGCAFGDLIQGAKTTVGAVMMKYFTAAETAELLTPPNTHEMSLIHERRRERRELIEEVRHELASRLAGKEGAHK